MYTPTESASREFGDSDLSMLLVEGSGVSLVVQILLMKLDRFLI